MFISSMLAESFNGLTIGSNLTTGTCIRNFVMNEETSDLILKQKSMAVMCDPKIQVIYERASCLPCLQDNSFAT